ncbi:MAG: SusC/RagA family TonB-linked outer membrane protein, partial [Saprospiraceae bacterium]
MAFKYQYLKKYLQCSLFCLFAFNFQISPIHAETRVFKNAFKDIEISGRVTDEDGLTLPGVSIKPVGQAGGSITDVNGNYTISVPNSTTLLEFTYVGFLAQKVEINGRKTIDVILKTDIKLLNEVVVVGYGVEQKKTLTGSVGIIKGESLKDLPVPTIDGILQGQTTGVQVTQNSGTPGGGMSVRIRGVSSIGGSSQPLYVIDGIPVTTGDFAQIGYEGQGVNQLSDLNPNDVESISILKDAASASIYGARASNGVVLITTKRGSNKKSSVNFSASYGWQQAANQLDMLNARDWKLYRNDLAKAEIFSAEQIADNKVDVNWQDVIFRTAPMANYELSASGGDEKTKFFISGNLFDQEGILIGTDYRRINGRVNLDHKVNERLNIGT